MSNPDQKLPIDLAHELEETLRELAESPNRSKLSPLLGRVVAVQEFLDEQRKGIKE